MNLSECDVLHSTTTAICGKLLEFKNDFLAFLEDALSDAAAELSKGTEVSLPQTPTLKRGRLPKEVPAESTPKAVGDQIIRDDNPPPSKRALRLRGSSPKLASEAAAETSVQSQPSTSTSARIDDPSKEQKKSRSPQQPATASPQNTSALRLPRVSLVLTHVDETDAQPPRKSQTSFNRPVKRLTPAKPPRKMRMASQSARKKIGQNYLDENTDPTKLRLESAGVISKVVGTGKGRKYVPSVEPEVEQHQQVAQTLVPPVDDVDGVKRRSQRNSGRITGVRVSQRVKGLQPQQTVKKPVPTMVVGRSSVSPPETEKHNFRSFVQVSLSPIRAVQLRLPRVTCSPMKVVAARLSGAGRGTFAVTEPEPDNTAGDEEGSTNDNAQPISVGRGTFVVPDTAVASKSSVQGTGDANRGTFCLPPRRSLVPRASDASLRRGRLVSRVLARASMSRSMRNGSSRTSVASGDVTVDTAMTVENVANVPTIKQDSPTEKRKSDLEKRLFKKFSLMESVVVIQKCDPNVDIQQQETSKRQVSASTEDVTPDSGVESVSNMASSPIMSKKPDANASDNHNDNSPNQDANASDNHNDNSPNQGLEGSFASCHSSYSPSVISNTPSPTCPKEKVVRPKLVFSSTRKVSLESKTIRGGSVSSKKKATNIESALKHFLGGGKKYSSAVRVKQVHVAVDQSDRVSLVGRASHIRKPSVASSTTRTPISKTKRSQGSLLSGSITTPLSNKLGRQHTLTMSEQRSEIAAKNRKALMNQRTEEQIRKRDEKNRKLQEALEKKRQLQEEKSKKLKEQEERKHQLALQKKREQEEQQRQEEKRREMERQREQEAEVARQQAAKMERLREKMLEKERIAREKAEMERLQAAERALKEKQERLLAAEKSQNAANVSKTATKPKANLNVTFTNDPPDVCVSYDMTPQQILPLPNVDPDNYDIADLKEDSTDDEGQPRKEVPAWASGRCFRVAMLDQFRKAPNVLEIFPPDELMRLPQLTEIFKVKKARYNQRGSSADWNTPPIRKVSKVK